MQTNTVISTEQLAAKFLVKANTIRSAFCREGHYFGIKPTKLPNGRLVWPVSEAEVSSGLREAK